MVALKATSGERIAMQVSKQSVVELLRKAGLFEVAEYAEQTFPDPVDLDDAQKLGFERFGITRDDLISRLGGSP
jgi:hypothetical protein